MHYIYNEEDKIALVGKDNDDVDNANDGNWRIQRYKGLGEMNASELKETTMDPKNRILKQITVEDIVMADKTFDMLMGTDVPARKSYITTNAKNANVDR